MTRVKVAAIRVLWGHNANEPHENVIRRGFALAEEAAAKGARYIVIPENFLDSPDPRQRLIPGPLTDRAVELARKINAYICCGITECAIPRQPHRKDRYDLYLSAIVAGPEGLLSVHRKVDNVVDAQAPDYRDEHPKTDCQTWSGGDFEMHAMGELKRVGIMICRDSASSWAWSRVLSQDPQIIFHPNLRSSLTKYGANLPYMAKRYGVPIVAPDGHPESESMIIDRNGTILDVETQTERPLVAEVTLAGAHPNYVKFEVLDNRPEDPVKFTKRI